jgi:hypothetical protein
VGAVVTRLRKDVGPTAVVVDFLAQFLERHGHSAGARAIVDAERHEVDLYERFSSFVSYGFYIAIRAAD